MTHPDKNSSDLSTKRDEPTLAERLCRLGTDFGDEYAHEVCGRSADAIAEMSDALRPFVTFANVFDAPGTEHSSRPKSGEWTTITMRFEGRECDFTLTVEDFMRARAALAKARGQS